ncbi:3-hydroxyacyl-CoA dehydrogenase NAD-binding domain-containing protein [Egicoccus halophilus]|uniref:enoyl-CoA hydratase n=1 Tax=Egicoccus halophilus TaxID=1670830 RepID=A0A8J3AH29_9ACTN|nr:3-hydroxyacyl-CoA dehydrogenase NAD-binding domain-containing protein [Egicoccus halophilus]GGI09549.1 3-hydroxyacyl-CoA dehydrogenase [Egicoccus halophilus]
MSDDANSTATRDRVYTRFKLTYDDSPTAGRLAILTMDNGRDHTKPNTFGAQALASLDEALDEFETQTDVKGLLLTGKQFIFAVGADLTQFTGMDAEAARAGGEGGHAVFARLMALPFPTLAAINGACMGGGLEIALHCDYRTVSTGAAAIAFPEVFLSIVPGWGGTQLAPRVVGARNALDAIVVNALNNNKVMKPREAFERGFADRLIDSAVFLDESLALLERLVTGQETIERPGADGVDPTEGLDEALTDVRAFVDAKVHGATRAPYLALELIEFAARGGDLDEGRRKESEALAQLLPADQAQASVYAFDLVQNRAKKQPWRPDAPPRRLSKVAVVGAGLMGAQLGALHLQRLELPLVLKDIDEGVLDRCREHVEGELDKQVAKGRLKPGKAAFLKGLVTYTTSYDDVRGADWVIEAVLERMDLKQAIFADLEEVLDEGAVLATNTSSLSVGEMAAKLAHPERVVGFHFFNPVAVLPLVEVIRPEGVSDAAMATAFDVAKKLRKTGVQCADRPAFIVNRLLSRFNGTAVQALRRGNDFREIDEAVKGLGLPMGPFELFGLVGLQVAFHTAETLAEAFPDRFVIDDNFRAIAHADVPGIYDWSAGGEVFAAVRAAVEVDADATPMSADEIRRVALEAAADECARMLDDGTVADARDIDTGMILGAGFPFFLGGLCRHLDQTGISQAVAGRPLVTAEDHAQTP